MTSIFHDPSYLKKYFILLLSFGCGEVMFFPEATYHFLFQINMLLNFSAGDDCTCPEELQEELQSFHDDLRLHCGMYLSIVYQHTHPITLQVTVLGFEKKKSISISTSYNLVTFVQFHSVLIILC